jgi:hypothetical protein
MKTMSDCERCFASKARQTIIDVLRPDTGRTWCYGKTLDQCREEYPDAEEMSVDEFCAWKAAQQRTPITWMPTTAEQFDDMLNCLPPALMLSGGFLVGEPDDYDAGNGQPRFQGYRQRGDVYEVGNRPMTRAEFRSEIANAELCGESASSQK